MWDTSLTDEELIAAADSVDLVEFVDNDDTFEVNEPEVNASQSDHHQQQQMAPNNVEGDHAQSTEINSVVNSTHQRAEIRESFFDLLPIERDPPNTPVTQPWQLNEANWIASLFESPSPPHYGDRFSQN